MSSNSSKAATQDAMSAGPLRPRRQPVRASLDLENVSDEVLLATRFCDLPIKLEGTLMARRVARLHGELRRRGIVALPHAWLSEEFFSPDGVLGFAIPFYLAHPRLMRLERSQMLEVEGAGEAECRRILRHEAGHAIDDAYALSRRQRYRDLFGDAEDPYPDSYRPRPESRDFVINLANWYAQAHPVEDFAETFAIWLNPHIDCRRDYKDWPALAKLEYVDELMREIAGKPPEVPSVREVEPLRRVRRTLGEHYEAKRTYYAWDWAANYDQELRRIFSDDSKDANAPAATRFLRRVRPQLRTRIAAGTGVHAYAVDQLLRQMIARAQKLGLRVIEPPNATFEKLLVLLTMQTARVLHTGYPKVAL
jgi:putative zinc-binding metallo-peptidase